MVPGILLGRASRTWWVSSPWWKSRSPRRLVGWTRCGCSPRMCWPSWWTRSAPSTGDA